MDSWVVRVIFVFLLIVSSGRTSGDHNTSFYENYKLTWGFDHALLSNQERDIQLSLYSNSGGAGFESKVLYASGFFHIRMKIPDKNSSGVVTTFYLSSRSDNHDEIDIEMLGNNGPPYKLHTNLFTNGRGDREQRLNLWFDPTKDFHSYKLLWNEYQVVFYVDDVPVRVFKNNTQIGVSYPTQQMYIMASIWNAEWASDKKIDWSQAPFQAHYQDFSVAGCVIQDNHTQQCYSSKFWWNSEKHWRLNPDEQRSYKNVRSKYLVYDYCSDKPRFPNQPPECQSNQ